MQDDPWSRIAVTGGTRAQTVTQPEDHISVIEGAPVQVKCNYSYSGSPELFWYVQYPKQGLQLLLKHFSKESTKGFTANLDKSGASFHLKKPAAQEEDSAMYYCVLRATVTGFTKEAEHKPLGSYSKYFIVSSLWPTGGHSLSRHWVCLLGAISSIVNQLEINLKNLSKKILTIYFA